MTENPCVHKIVPVCVPKECGVELCKAREIYEARKLAIVDGGWGGFALEIWRRAQERKAKSKTKKQIADELTRRENNL